MAKDPVCGMQVDEKKAAATAVHQGTTYYFCAPGCKTAFEKSPEKYIGKSGATPATDAPGGCMGGAAVQRPPPTIGSDGGYGGSPAGVRTAGQMKA
jgi:YHS domain-containing protein